MNTYYIELDFVRAEIKETGIAISQGDYGRVKFSIAVKKDGEIITDAVSADISFQLTNGYIVQGVLSGAAGLYDYIFQGNELQAPGKTIATVTLNYADGRTSSEAFSFDVRYNPLYGRFINAGPYITDLENIKSQAQAYVEYLEKLIEQIKQEMGQTALTKESLANNFDVTEEGVKALDAAAGRTLDIKKVDKTAIVQAESTDTTTVPSSAYFKQVTDRVISDLAYFVRSDIAYNDYVTKLAWSNTIIGTEQFFVITIAVTSAKIIPASTIIGTLPFNVVENSVPVLYQDSYIIAYGKNLRIEKEIAAGTTILAYIPTRILK